MKSSFRVSPVLPDEAQLVLYTVMFVIIDVHVFVILSYIDK